MSKQSLDKFLMLVERSKLIHAEELARVVADWKSRATLADLDDAQPCADHLVDTGVLTLWQCRKLLEGRHRGFYLGRYKLLDHLGSGGMSSVYLAEHVLMQRRVAVKVLPHNRVSDSSYLARFHFEGQAAAALDHRNIVRAYDLDNDGRIHYLVMEYVEGRDLHAVVCQDGPLDYHSAANYVAQAATGLEHAHQAGMVHRDIKPANLLVDLKGTLKILDMGLAKFTAGKGATPGFAADEQVLGTADYLAPEQAVNSQTVDHRADIYALGCTLYYLLTGHPPFASGTPLERMTAHQNRVPPSVFVDRPDAPAELVAICNRMMEKSADRRYQTAGEARDALSAWLDNEATFGRVSRERLLAATNRRSAVGTRDNTGSKINIVSGSTSDLHRTSANPQVASELQDTDSNLHRATLRMPARRSEPRSDSADVLPSKSDVLPASQLRPGSSGALVPSADAPMLSPPSSDPVRALWDAQQQDAGLAERVSLASGEALEPAFFDPENFPRARRSKTRADVSWFWIVALGGTALAALIAVLSTFWG